MAQTANLDVDQGAAYSVTYLYQDEDGTPIDVTGWGALMQLRTSAGAILILALSDASGITVGETDGSFLVEMTSEQTMLLNQDCHYDLLVTESNGNKTRIVEGTVAVDLAISVPA